MRPFLLCALMCAVLSVRASAVVPSSITVQGRLTDASGTPLPVGAKTFTFRIVDDSVGGTEIWPGGGGEVQSITSDASGLWIGLLGAIDPLTDAVFSDNLLWLEIDVNGTTLPTTQLLTGPYAFRVSTVDGATGGTISSKVSIGPGHVNSGTNAFVAGSGNTATGTCASVAGGESNIATADHAFVGGGLGDTAGHTYAVIAGGRRNRTNDSYGAILGGFANAAGLLAAVGGGQSNHAIGDFSVVCGGNRNRAYGEGSVIGGGGTGIAIDSNHANGIGATIPGGNRNRTDGNFAFAAGRRAHANHDGTFVWADSSEADFASTGADQFLIRASGGVGIGTNDPEAPLHILETSAGTVTANANSIIVLERSAGGWISLVSADASQRGILFSEPTTGIAGGIVFDANNANDFAFRTGGNTTRMTLDASGNLTADGCVVGSNIACPSDSRFKRNITTLPNALATVGKLRGVNYTWETSQFPEREFPAGEQVGLIAQEVREVVPQAVVEQADGYLAVDYARLVPLLIEGMKEQQDIINRQNERIASLEKKLEQ